MPGRYYDEWTVGTRITHQPSRTVTETDNLMFSAMTHNMQPLHLDAEYAKASEFGQILVNSTFTFSLAVGLSIADTTVGTLIANLGFDKIVTPKPVWRYADLLHRDHGTARIEVPAQLRHRRVPPRTDQPARRGSALLSAHGSGEEETGLVAVAELAQ
jgi:MaoC like domain